MMSLKLDHITLMVRSLEKSMPYYDKLLKLIGFEKLREHVWSNDNGFFSNSWKQKKIQHLTNDMVLV
jgi:hypothetical protein